MEAVSTLALLLGGSFTAGINLYLTIAVFGLAQRFGWIPLPESLAVLGDPWVIGVAGALYAIEFIADKVPFVDSAWDSVHTIIRPLGTAALGFMAATDASPAAQLAIALVAGTIALDAHLTKATARAAINTSPEPVSNIAASVTEDVLVIGLVTLVAKYPLVAAIVAILLIVASIWFLRKMIGFLRSVLARLRHPHRRAAESG